MRCILERGTSTQLGDHTIGRKDIEMLLSENYPLLAILVGSALISLALGPFRNTDTNVEFGTAQGVLTWGYPYLGVKGNLFNIPPLGFYAEALFFLVVAPTMENGVVLITLFGLASAVMVYLLGKEMYSKTAGLFAAALFALAPWQLVMSRAFLVDALCLLLSLVCLFVGILAIRKDSVKLALVSGFFFAAALLTKQYAVFVLIPLLLLYLYHRPKNSRQILLQLGAFILPALHATLIWYNVIMKKWLLYFVQHSDFNDFNLPGVIPSYSFMSTFLVDYGLGIFFATTIVFSLIVGFLFWKRFPRKSVVFDLVCLTTIVIILGVNMYLGVAQNLKAPYTSAFKYSYQSLPFFSLIAGSLVTKSASLLKSRIDSDRLKQAFSISLGSIGLFLLVATVLDSMNTAHYLAGLPHLIFRVNPAQDLGYNFTILQASQSSVLGAAQFLGFLVVFSGLFWASVPFFRSESKHDEN